MKHAALLCLAFAFCLLSSVCQGQSTPGFSSPDLLLKDGYLVISYDILNGEPGDIYNVRLEITDSTGNPLQATALAGDVGRDIPGGDNKLIRWNFARDQVDVNQGIYVEIFGEVISRANTSRYGSPESKMKTVLRSVAFPGWGLTKTSGNKLHLIKGVLGYSCIAGSLIFNSAALNNYNSYLDSTDPSSRPVFYQSYENQNVISKVSGFTAVAIWITDVAWTFLGSAEKQGTNPGYQSAGLTLGSDLEAYTGLPMVSLRYTF